MEINYLKILELELTVTGKLFADFTNILDFSKASDYAKHLIFKAMSKFCLARQTGNRLARAARSRSFMKSAEAAMSWMKKELPEKQYLGLLAEAAEEESRSVTRFRRLECTPASLKAAEEFFGPPAERIEFTGEGIPGECMLNSVKFKNPHYGIVLHGNQFTIHAWNQKKGTVTERTPGYCLPGLKYYGKPLNMSSVKELKFCLLPWPDFVKDEVARASERRSQPQPLTEAEAG